MPSADDTISGIDAWSEGHKRILCGYAEKIEACIDASDWAALSSILEGRQEYLEQLFLTPFPEDYRGALKQMAQGILRQDETFQLRIQQQKKLATQQQQSIERGRRAIEAYSGQ